MSWFARPSLPQSGQGVSALAVVGGVSANSRLRARWPSEPSRKALNCFCRPSYCADNVAMIAAAGQRALPGECRVIRLRSHAGPCAAGLVGSGLSGAPPQCSHRKEHRHRHDSRTCQRPESQPPAALERLYRRRIPASVVLTAELARTTTQLSREIRRPIGLLITRRGAIEQVLVGAGCAPTFESLAKFRVGSHSLRGLRLIRTHLHDEPLSQDDLTHLALLRLDLIGALGVTETANPACCICAPYFRPINKARCAVS